MSARKAADAPVPQVSRIMRGVRIEPPLSAVKTDVSSEETLEPTIHLGTQSGTPIPVVEAEEEDSESKTMISYRNELSKNIQKNNKTMRQMIENEKYETTKFKLHK